jgi:vacuolar protein sorting-associated protein IST1
LAVQRLRTLQDKKEAQAKVSRRDIATLLERNKTETARIKVENSTSSFCIG